MGWSDGKFITTEYMVHGCIPHASHCEQRTMRHLPSNENAATMKILGKFT
jgi:hypothetical protein